MTGQHVPIACVGTLLIDSIGVVDRYPNQDERVESVASALTAGGNAANAAITVARLGIDVDFYGVVGDDAMGRAAVEALQSEGVGTSGVVISPNQTTGSSLVIVCRQAATRSIVTRPAPVPMSVPVGYDWLHVDKCGYEALRAAGGSASQVSLDDGNPVPNLDLQLVDLFVPTLTALVGRFDGLGAYDAAGAALASGAGTVVATAGPQGSFAMSSDDVACAPAFPIDPVSSLGAGDVFHGALLAARCLGKNLSDAIRFANVTAALSCLALDGHSGVPDRATVEAALAALPPSPDDSVVAIRALHT